MTRTAKTLALGELEASACAALTVFLALDHSRVAGQEAIRLKGGVVTLIDLAQSARNGMTASASLAGRATANYRDNHIVAILAGRHHKRLTNRYGKFRLAKILIELAIVYHDFTSTLAKIDTSDGTFSSANTDSEILNHGASPYAISTGVGF
jgi:hypothetical protein